MLRSIQSVLLLLVLFATTGTWLHSFEHIHLEGESECEYVVYANLAGSDQPHVFVFEIPALAEEELDYFSCVQHRGLGRHKFPFRNKAPPAM